MTGKDDAFVEKYESLARRVLDDADVAALRDAVFALPEPGSLQQVLASLRLGPARHAVHSRERGRPVRMDNDGPSA